MREAPIVKEKKPVDTYIKMDIIQSKRYMQYKDLLAVILEDEKQYALRDVNRLLEKVLATEVSEKRN